MGSHTHIYKVIQDSNYKSYFSSSVSVALNFLALDSSTLVAKALLFFSRSLDLHKREIRKHHSQIPVLYHILKSLLTCMFMISVNILTIDTCLVDFLLPLTPFCAWF